MKDNSRQKDQIFLWLLLFAALLSLLVYGLSSFVQKPTIETITTHPPNANSKNQPHEINYRGN